MKRPGQVVLFPFPYTNFTGAKLRPALLLGKLPGDHDDWLICMISSQLHQAVRGFDEVVAEDDADFATSGLKATSLVRLGRLAVVEGNLLAGAIGIVAPERFARIKRHLNEWVNSL